MRFVFAVAILLVRSLVDSRPRRPLQEPGENWLDETFGLRRDKMRSIDLPKPWLDKVP